MDDATAALAMSALAVAGVPARHRPGPAGQARPEAIVGMLSAAVDADSATLVALIAARGQARAVRTETWTLDLCTNTWRRRHPAYAPVAASWTNLVHDASADVVVALSAGDPAT